MSGRSATALSGGPHADRTALTDTRIDYEEKVMRELAAWDSAVEEARGVLAGVRAANPNRALWADSVELRYIADMQWKQVARALGASDRVARENCWACMDWLDFTGLARARELGRR